MSIPLPYADQFECRNETLEVYASDRRGLVQYQFNNFGYRNNIDYEDTAQNVGVYIGSSITAGIGIDWPKAFASSSSHALGVNCYHFAQGCTGVDNREILRMLQGVKQSAINAKYYVIQFIQLNRQYDSNTGQTTHCHNHSENIDKFLTVFDQVQNLLTNDHWCFLGCDEQQHALPDSVTKHPRCVTWNPQFIDLAGVGGHPGEKWHKMINQAVVNKLRNFELFANQL